MLPRVSGDKWTGRSGCDATLDQRVDQPVSAVSTVSTVSTLFAVARLAAIWRDLFPSATFTI